MYLDGIVLKRSWAGGVRNASLLVAIGVNGESYREIPWRGEILAWARARCPARPRKHAHIEFIGLTHMYGPAVASQMWVIEGSNLGFCIRPTEYACALHEQHADALLL